MSTTDRPLSRLVIFGSGRAGSSLLVDLLNSRPDMLCEYGMVPEGYSDPHHWLESRIDLAKHLGVRAYGVRLLIPHLVDKTSIPDIHDLLKRLECDGWHIVSLRRADPARTVISYVHAARSGFHLKIGEGSRQYEPISVGAEELAHWLDVFRSWLGAERASLEGVNWRELVYERDLATEESQQATVGLISAWLGMPAETVHTSFRRQLPDRPLSALIANYSEIRPALDQFTEACRCFSGSGPPAS